MPTGSRAPFPIPPDLPRAFGPAPGELGSGDSWEQVQAGADVVVAADGETLSDVRLDESVWTDAQLVARRFTGLICKDVRFSHCDLAGLVLEDCQFTRVVFESCRLSGAIFAGATLQEVEFVDCVAGHANFRMAHLRRTAAGGTDLREADFYGCRLTDVRLSTCELSDANFQGATAERLDLRGSRVGGLRGVDALGGTRIDTDQVVPLGAALLGALEFRVD